MPTAFDIAAATLFADPNLAQNATFIPQVGGNVPVRVILRALDAFQKIGTSAIETSTQMLEVKVADCPLIKPGDQFLIGSTTYTVQGEPLRDETQLVWKVDIV